MSVVSLLLIVLIAAVVLAMLIFWAMAEPVSAAIAVGVVLLAVAGFFFLAVREQRGDRVLQVAREIVADQRHLEIEIRADSRVSYGNVFPVMSAATDAGISKMNITALVEAGR